MTVRFKLQIAGVAVGLAYGLMIRAWIHAGFTLPFWVESTLFVMSVAFIMVVPFSMGYLSISIEARRERTSFLQRIFMPWAVVLLALLASALTAWEGFICIVMMTPIALLFGSMGGWIAGALVRPSQPNAAVASMAIVALLPFMLGPIEQRLPPHSTIRTVESDVSIHAAPDVIWRNIERVRAIDPAELPPSWNRRIGFPRPIEATLSHEGIGGVRHATFAGNVLFIETIDEWESEHRLGFSIRADTKSIPPTTLDEHVTVGGPYFDVLHGEYILEPTSAGETRLRLISRHRVSTDFNWYAQLWTDAVMRDVQRSILYVVKNRCEKVGSSRVDLQACKLEYSIVSPK